SRPHERLDLRVDVADDAAVEAAFDQVMTTWSQLDLVVTSAAVNRTPGDGRSELDARMREGTATVRKGGPIGSYPDQAAEMSAQGWERMLAVNLSGTFYAARAAVRRMDRGGSIVCVTSVAAQSGAGPVHYTAAKA